MVVEFTLGEGIYLHAYTHAFYYHYILHMLSYST
jgi:hypothetical protein